MYKKLKKIMTILLISSISTVFGPQSGLTTTSYGKVRFIKESSYWWTPDFAYYNLTHGDYGVIDFSGFVPPGTKQIYLRVSFRGDLWVPYESALVHLFPPRIPTLPDKSPMDYGVGLTIYVNQTLNLVEEHGFLEVGPLGNDPPTATKAKYYVFNTTPLSGAFYITVLGYAMQ